MILALGEILFDELPSGRRPGGAPFNFAQHLHRLGHNVRFASAIGGRDNEGMELLRLILNAGLDPNFVQRHSEAPTGRVAVTVDANGIPAYDIVRNVAYDFIDFDALPAIEPNLIYFGSLIQRTRAGRARLQAYLKSFPNSVRRFYDVNFRDGCVSPDILVPSLKQTDILKLNDDELPIVGKLTGIGDAGDALIERLMQTFGIEQIALTRGPQGCALYTPDGKTEEPPGPLRKEDIIDTVGAGDAFAAMLAHGTLNNLDPRQTLQRCTQLAEFVCTISGAVPPDDRIYQSLNGETS